jgi:molybdopterin synthase catalytic subunit
VTVRLQSGPFDYGGECGAFARSVAGAGAVVTFLGVVRDEGGRLSQMEIEHYPGMTERALAAIGAEAERRWSLAGWLILHRHGSLRPGDPIMMVATAARHRQAAFEAAEFLMDYLKSRAPFWKKEFGADGAEWVAARDEDEAALGRWSRSSPGV